MTQGDDIVLRGRIKHQEHGEKKIKTLRPRKPMSEGKSTLIYYSLVTLSLIPLLILVVSLNHPLGGLVFILYTIVCFMQPNWFMRLFDTMIGPWRGRQFDMKSKHTRELLDIPVELTLSDPEGANPTLSWEYKLFEAETIEEVVTPTMAQQDIDRPLDDGQIDLDSPQLKVELTRDPFNPRTLHLEMRHTTTRQRLVIQLDDAQEALALAQNSTLTQISRHGVELGQQDQRTLLEALLRIVQHSGARAPKELKALVEV